MNQFKTITLALAFILTAAIASAQQAKYIFYFIGDGMGPNQVQITELYGGELNGEIGIQPLCFTQFPVASMATTFSATNGVTDSAASGTALATGEKTANGCIGVASDKATPLKSLAYRAKEAGRRVGVSTSVGINHATPAAFYAHNASRKNYNQIGRELPVSGFDFFGGSDFWGVTPQDSAGLYDLARQNGYTIARGYKEYQKKAKKADKMILFQPEKASKIDSRTLPYTIDRQKGDMTLPEIVRAGINFLTKDNSDEGFFLMVEGGAIDWHGHSNDAATLIHEVRDFDAAIAVAYEFYVQHPDETLIVVTADHETGSLNLGISHDYALNLQVLRNQKISEVMLSRLLNDAHRANKGNLPWEQAKKILADNFGLYTAIEVSADEDAALQQALADSYTGSTVESEYQKNVPLATKAKQIVNSKAIIGWGSGDHSASFVPVFAIGAGAECFNDRTDNARIARTIAEIGGF